MVRYSNGEGGFLADAIVLEEEQQIDCMYHPFEKEKHLRVSGLHQEELFIKVMEDGEIITDQKTVEEIAEFSRQRLALLPNEHKRFEYPHIYKVGISKKLMEARDAMVRQFRGED